jgi:nitrile hydratase
MDGFTLPEREEEGPILKEEWQRLLWGLVWSLRVPGISGGGRAGIERMPPALYLSMPYYAKWLYRAEQSVLNSGFVTEEELANPDGSLTIPDIPGFTPPGPEIIVDGFLAQDSSEELAVDVEPLFSVGDAVVARNEHPVGHTRAPRYVRGRRGTIHRDHGVHLFQDDIPPGVDRGPQHLYSVVFTGSELWGSRGNPRDRIYVELWDDHLQPVA